MGSSYLCGFRHPPLKHFFYFRRIFQLVDLRFHPFIIIIFRISSKGLIIAAMTVEIHNQFIVGSDLSEKRSKCMAQTMEGFSSGGWIEQFFTQIIKCSANCAPIFISTILVLQTPNILGGCDRETLDIFDESKIDQRFMDGEWWSISDSNR